LIITVPKGKDRNEIYTYSWGIKRRSYNYSELKNILGEYGNILELTGLCPLGFLTCGAGRLFQFLNLYKFRCVRTLDKALENIYRGGGRDIFALVHVCDDLPSSSS